MLHKRTIKREQFYLLVSHELQKHLYHTLKTLRDAFPPSLSLSSIAKIIQDLGFSEKSNMENLSPKHYARNEPLQTSQKLTTHSIVQVNFP